MSFVHANGPRGLNFAEPGAERGVSPTGLDRLPKVIKIAAIAVLAVVDLALIVIDSHANVGVFAADAGKFPSYWWLTIIAACAMVGVPAAVVLVFWRRMKDASSGRWNADNILWSCLGSLVVGIVGFVLAVHFLDDGVHLLSLAASDRVMRADVTTRMNT